MGYTSRELGNLAGAFLGTGPIEMSRSYAEDAERRSEKRHTRAESRRVKELSPEEKAFFEEEQKRLQKLAELKTEIWKKGNEHPKIAELITKREIASTLAKDAYEVINTTGGLFKRLFDRAGIKNKEALLQGMQSLMEGYIDDSANIAKEIYQQKLEEIKILKNERKIDESEAEELKKSAERTLWNDINEPVDLGHRLSFNSSDRERAYFQPLDSRMDRLYRKAIEESETNIKTDEIKKKIEEGIPS